MDDTAKRTVLVVGSTGNLGTEVVRQLCDAAWTVRAMARDPAEAEHLASLGAEVVPGDLTDRTSLGPACKGADYVVASAHAALSRGRSNPQSVDGQGNRDLIDVAVAMGVKHFVYVSAMDIGPDHPVDFFRIKYATEQYLEASGLLYTIVRGGAFMETQHVFVGASVLKSGKAIVFGRGDKANNPVSVKDVARFVVLALQDERLRNRRINVAGPEKLTPLQIVEIYEEVTGRPASRKHIPVPVLRMLSVIVAPFHPVARRMFRMGALIGSTEAPYDMAKTLAEFPMQLTRFEDSAREWARSAASDQQAKAAAGN